MPILLLCLYTTQTTIHGINNTAIMDPDVTTDDVFFDVTSFFFFTVEGIRKDSQQPAEIKKR